MERLNDTGELSDSDEKHLNDAIAEAIDYFGPDFDAEGQPLEEGESDRIRSEEEHARPGRSAAEGNGEGAEEAAEQEPEEVTA
jgi:F-type H+-transporting ATPase subunit alpha